MLLTLGSPSGDRDKAPHFVPPEDRTKPLRHKLADTEPRALIQKLLKNRSDPLPHSGTLRTGPSTPHPEIPRVDPPNPGHSDTQEQGLDAEGCSS